MHDAKVIKIFKKIWKMFQLSQPNRLLKISTNRIRYEIPTSSKLLHACEHAYKCAYASYVCMCKWGSKTTNKRKYYKNFVLCALNTCTRIHKQYFRWTFLIYCNNCADNHIKLLFSLVGGRPTYVRIYLPINGRDIACQLRMCGFARGKIAHKRWKQLPDVPNTQLWV